MYEDAHRPNVAPRSIYRVGAAISIGAVLWIGIEVGETVSDALLSDNTHAAAHAGHLIEEDFFVGVGVGLMCIARRMEQEG
jgi:hypothetical protein